MNLVSIKAETKLDNSTFSEMLSFLAIEKQNKIRRFFRWEDAYNTLFAELLVRYEIMDVLRIRNQDIVFKTEPNGKPFLENDSSFHFNVSHSGNWAVVASDNEPIGIDIEQVMDIDLTLAERFFCHKEYEDILTNTNPKERFYDYWCLKESYLKCLGNGLLKDLSSFLVDFKSDEEIQVLEGEQIRSSHNLKLYNHDQGYKTAICTSKSVFQKEIHKIEIKNFVDRFKNKALEP